MNNEMALENLLKWYDLFCEKENCGLIDPNFTVIADNMWCRDFCNSDNRLVGEKFFNIWKELSKEKQTTIDQLLNKLLIEKNSIQFISANFSRKPEYIVAIFEYKPLINKYTNDIIAILVSAIKKNHPLRFYDIKRTLPLKAIEDVPLVTNGHGLTLMESEIAFLLFQAEDYAEISEIMTIVYGKNISKSTIAKKVRVSMYEKFKVYNLKALKNILHKNKYHINIPPSMVSGSIIILDHI